MLAEQIGGPLKTGITDNENNLAWAVLDDLADQLVFTRIRVQEFEITESLRLAASK